MKIDAIKTRLLVKYPTFGAILANVDLVEEKRIDTAATTGETIFYNPDFLASLKEDEQVFLFAHEVCHIAFDHILRSEGKDQEVWNIATDAVINALLQQDGLPLIQGGIDMKEALAYDAETFYDLLMKRGIGKHQDETGKNSKDSNQGHDDHTIWKEVLKEAKQNKNKIPSQSSSDKTGHKNESKENQSTDMSSQNSMEQTSEKSEKEIKEQLEQAKEYCKEKGEQQIFKENKQTRQEQLKELMENLAEKAQGRGFSSNGTKRNVQGIGKGKSLLDWRRLLKEAMKYDVDWSYQNASIEDGIVRPHLEEIPQAETEILLDTSGSINEVLLRNFLRECKNILHVSKLKVGCFDTNFYGFQEIRTEKDIENMEFLGGGGTDFNVAINAFSRRVENKIIFTDGDAPMPSLALDVIWVVFGGIQIQPKGGRVIPITKEKLQRLSYQQNVSFEQTESFSAVKQR